MILCSVSLSSLSRHRRLSCFVSQAELQKGIDEGLARVAELEQRAAALSVESGDVDGEDPVSKIHALLHTNTCTFCFDRVWKFQ